MFISSWKEQLAQGGNKQTLTMKPKQLQNSSCFSVIHDQKIESRIVNQVIVFLPLLIVPAIQPSLLAPVLEAERPLPCLPVIPERHEHPPLPCSCPEHLQPPCSCILSRGTPCLSRAAALAILPTAIESASQYTVPLRDSHLLWRSCTCLVLLVAQEQ